MPDKFNANSVYLALINKLLPFMSREDQQAMSSSLFRADPKNFGQYNPQKLTINPGGDITTGQRQEFTSAERAEGILQALKKFAVATGKSTKELGPGFRFLQSGADILRDFGGTDQNGQTRTQYTQMQSQLDPLFAEGKSPKLSAYEPLLRALSAPFFSSGSVTPVSRTANGEYVFGTPQRGWF
jgi:hypothetical protein